MKIAIVSNLDTEMMQIIEKIKERALSMDIGIGEITPVQRMIDIPIAVRKMGERPDIDSILVIADFPELKMEHDSALFERIKADVDAIGMELKKPVKLEIFHEKEEIGEHIDSIMKEMLGED